MTSTTTAPALQSGTWTLDPVHSSATFRVQHFGLTWLRGAFPAFELQADVDADGNVKLTGGSDVEKISFANPQLHGHLMSPDFFDQQLHPRISFASTDVQLNDDGTAVVTGDLTIKGTTKSVELRGDWSRPIEGLGGDTRFGIELATDIDRNDFGVSWAATLPGGGDVVGRKVKLAGEFELVLS